jgi:hypothetical protein
MRRLANFVKFIDIYSNYFQLRINDQAKYKTIIGGIFSLITLGMIIFCFFIFGQDFFEKTNPKVTPQEGLFFDGYWPDIEGDQFPNKTILFGVEKEYDDYVKPISNFDKNDTEYNEFTRQCTEDELLDFNITSSENNSYRLYCIKLNDYTLKHSIVIKFVPCSILPKTYQEQMKSSNVTCAGQIKNEIKLVKMFILLPELGFSPEMEYPFITRQTYYFLNFNNQYTNNLMIPLNLYYLDNDDGWFLKNTKTYTDIDMSNRVIDSSLSSRVLNHPFVNIMIHPGDRFRRFTRTYMKIQELFTVIAGFMKVILIFMNIVNLIFRSYIIESYLILSQISDSISNVSSYKGTLNNKLNNSSTNQSSTGI